MRLAGENLNTIKRVRTSGLILIITISFFLLQLYPYLSNDIYNHSAGNSEFIHSSAETEYNQEWLSNNNFATQDDWFYSKGALGDNFPQAMTSREISPNIATRNS